ncbi:transcriptional regulator [Alteribacter lacisalsi]|uniref:Transcriptional regulator n=2 Tax=Alteribacter lacisalsi TaxID=2045244 RepID=A0A2W0H380_9BACI|nr:transcriptional regulator [Alteribacter lacisalsi]
MRKQKRSKSKFRRFMKFTLVTMAILLVFAGLGAAYIINQINTVTSNTQLELERGSHSEYREEEVSLSSDPVSVLFLGIDSRDSNLRGLSDAMVLATFNPNEGTVKMLNIPRDSRVEIVGRGTQDKINHAHAFGGVDMTIDTVENFLQVPVDYFATINFTAFMEIIDAFGGVEVEVPFSFTEIDSEDNQGEITVEEGTQNLMGEEALAFVRTRRFDSDLARGERQKEVIEALIREAASLSSITRYGDVMDSVEDHMKTNLSFSDLVGFHSYSDSLDTIESLSFKGTDNTIDGVYYYQVNEDSLAEISTRLRVHLELEEAAAEQSEEDSEGEAAGETGEAGSQNQ